MGNTFNCVAYGIQISSIGRFQGLSITHNVFTDSQNNALQLLTHVGPVIEVFHNSFVNCSSDIVLSITLYYSGVISTSDLLSISGNTFITNRGSNVVNINCQSNCWDGSSKYTSSIQMMDNEFLRNAVANTLTTTCAGLNVTRNRFANPLADYEYRVSVSYSPSLVMYAAFNYWNVSSYADVSARVYDHSIDDGDAEVQLVPWYTDYDLSSVDDGSSFVKGETADAIQIGGTLSSSITLTKQLKNYQVVESIFVPAGIQMKIEAGVTLLFERGGITVEGRSLTRL